MKVRIAGKGQKASNVRKIREEEEKMNPMDAMDAAAKVAQKRWNKMDEEVRDAVQEFFNENLKAGYKRLGKIIRGVDWTKKRKEEE